MTLSSSELSLKLLKRLMRFDAGRSLWSCSKEREASSWQQTLSMQVRRKTNEWDHQGLKTEHSSSTAIVDYVTALRNLGALYLKRKELDESEGLFKKLLELQVSLHRLLVCSRVHWLSLQQEEFGNSNAKLIPTLASLSDVSLSRYNQV